TFAAGVAAPFALLAAATLSWPARQQEVAITGAHVVDTASGSIIDGQTVYIKDGRIVQIGPSAIHPEWPRLDAQGQYLLPGLIDVHTHLQSPVEVRSGFKAGYCL